MGRRPLLVVRLAHVEFVVLENQIPHCELVVQHRLSATLDCKHEVLMSVLILLYHQSSYLEYQKFQDRF